LPDQQVAAQDVSRIDGIRVPSAGEWMVRLWLEDAAGNVDSTRVATTTLRYGSPPLRTAPAPSPPISSSPSAAPPPDLATPPLASPPTAVQRRDPLLRLTSARLSRGHLIVRGRIGVRPRVRLSLIIRLESGRLLRRTVRIPGDRFTVSLSVRHVRMVTGRFAGNAAFRPARATVRPDP
jgi:hypothetical protein